MTLKRRICLIAAILLTLSQIFTMGIGASNELEQWILSNDKQTLIGYGGKTYYHYSTSTDLYLKPRYDYEYANAVSLGTVHSSSADPEIVWIESEMGEIFIYATSAGRTQLSKFENGKYGGYRLNDMGAYKYAELDKSVVEQMNAAGVTTVANVITVDVTMLKDSLSYEITAYDEAQMFACDIGRVFVDNNGSYYYVCYANLDNSYFDANGELSFRSGNITLVLLEGTAEATVKQASENMQRFDYEYEVEGSKEDAISVFWVFFVLGGFIMPIPFIIAGCVLATSDKRGRPKYWYTLSIIAALWLILSFVLMGLLL